MDEQADGPERRKRPRPAQPEPARIRRGARPGVREPHAEAIRPAADPGPGSSLAQLARTVPSAGPPRAMPPMNRASGRKVLPSAETSSVPARTASSPAAGRSPRRPTGGHPAVEDEREVIAGAGRLVGFGRMRCHRHQGQIGGTRVAGGQRGPDRCRDGLRAAAARLTLLREGTGGRNRRAKRTDRCERVMGGVSWRSRWVAPRCDRPAWVPASGRVMSVGSRSAAARAHGDGSDGPGRSSGTAVGQLSI